MTNTPDFINPCRVCLTTGVVLTHGLCVDCAEPEPSLATLKHWVFDGVAEATDGCRVEPDGTCPHGCESWLLVLGYI